MNSFTTLSSILGLGFASGVNLYAAILVVGLGQRFGWLSGLPGDLSLLANPIILVIAGVLYALEFFADKIPYVSVVWDSIHTFIRPLGGATLALASASKLSPELQGLALLAGGSLALGTHSTKMGYRLLAHASPEPVTDSIFSFAEDFGVIGLVLLTYKHPQAAIVVVAALVIGMAIVLPLLYRVLKFILRGITGRLTSVAPRQDAQPAPAWLTEELARIPGSGGRDVFPCFARTVPKAPKLQRGYLVLATDRPYFVYKGLFGRHVSPLEGTDLHLIKGLLFDRLSAQKWTVYFTKDAVGDLVRSRFTGVPSRLQSA